MSVNITNMSSIEQDRAIEVVNDWLSENGAVYDDIHKNETGYYIIRDFTNTVYLPAAVAELYAQLKY